MYALQQGVTELMAESTLLLFCLNPPLKPSQPFQLINPRTQKWRAKSQSRSECRARDQSPGERVHGADQKETLASPKRTDATTEQKMSSMLVLRGNPFQTVPGPFKLFWKCMFSKPGEEPTEPFFYLDLDPPKREEARLD